MRRTTVGGVVALLALSALQILIVAKRANSQVTVFQADQNFINNLVTQVVNQVNSTLKLAGDTSGVPTSNTTNHFSLTSDSTAGAHKITNLANGVAGTDAANLSQVQAVADPLITTTITAKNLNGTDSIGPFNGVHNNEINLADQPGFSNSMESIDCSLVSGNLSATCTGLGSTTFAVGQYVAIYAAGPTPTAISTPTVEHAGPVHTTTTPDGADFSVLASGCQAQDAYFWTTSGSPTVIVSNPAMYTPGTDSISVAGALANVAINSTNSIDAFTMNSNATGTVLGVKATGASCTTTRYYRAYVIDTKGQWIPSAVQTVTNTANAMTWSNWVDVLVTVQAGATAYALASCTDAGGATCHLIDVEVPNYSFSGTPTNWWNYDILYGRGAGKATPTKIMLHDLGVLNYGYDYSLGGSITGGTAPSARVPQILFTTIDGISGTTLTLHNAPSQTGTLQMVHDMGPVFNNAVIQACNATSFICGTIFVPSYRGTGQGYSVVTPLVAQNGFGLRIISDGATTTGDYSKSDPILGRMGQFNYRGPLGGTGLLVNNEGRFYAENFNLNGWTTMGVGLDLDEFGAFTVTTTVPSLKRITIGQSSVGLRLGNVNTGNVEFGEFSEVYTNQGTNVRGGIGMLVNSTNALRTNCTNCQLGGAIGVFSVAGFQMNGGQAGSPTNYISMWLPHYLADQVFIQNQRMEFGSRVYYSLVEGGAQATTAPLLINVHYQSMMTLYDGVVFALEGSGVPTFIRNTFETTTAAQGFCTDPQLSTPNKMLEMWSSSYSAITSLSNEYFALSTPYAGSGFTNVPWFGTDQYRESSNCNLTLVPAPAVGPTTPPAILTIDMGCPPFTLSSVHGTIQSTANCSVSTGGGTVTFTEGSNSGTAILRPNNQDVCRFYLEAGSASILEGSDKEHCSATAGNASTMNLSCAAGTCTITNNYSSPNYTFAFSTGP